MLVCRLHHPHHVGPRGPGAAPLGTLRSAAYIYWGAWARGVLHITSFNPHNPVGEVQVSSLFHDRKSRCREGKGTYPGVSEGAEMQLALNPTHQSRRMGDEPKTARESTVVGTF